MKVYISGPMTGIDSNNRPAFDEAAKRIRGIGLFPLNPFDTDGDVSSGKWSDYLKKDLRLLSEADAVAVLPGWEDSRGARLEVHIAFQLGMPVYEAGTMRVLFRRTDRDES